MAGCLGDQTIAAYVDGGLDLQAVARVDHHIDQCTTCRTQLSALVASPLMHSFMADATEPSPMSITDVDGVHGVLATGRAGDPLPDLVIGRYIAEAVIGRGAMGVVVRARDPELERVVAIKLVDPAYTAPDGTESGAWRARLRAEARAMARLRHPNVITVYDAGAVGDQLFVAMELVEGESLASRIARDRRGVLALCIGAGRGLCAAHAAGLVHGDVKPDNILVERDGRALIGDFGLARAIGDRPPDAAGQFLVGTPAYMAPERLRGGPADTSSDQFAFAVTVFEAYAGARPWRADSIDELRQVIARVPPVRPPAMPRRVWRVVARGLAVDPAARHPSVAALVDALERAGRTRTRWIAGGAAAAGVAVVALVVAPGSEPATCDDPVERAAAINPAGLCPSSPEPWCTALVAGLAGRAEAWRTTHVAICRATRDGRQSAELLDRRMRCLDQRLREHAALADRLASPIGKPDALDAVAALHRLEPPDRCASYERPVGSYPASKAAAIAEAQGWVASAAADYALGRYRAGVAALAPRLAAIQALEYPQLIATAALALGELQVQTGELAAAEASFDLGLQAAAKANDDTTTASLLLDLAHLLGELRQQWPRARELIRAADAAVVRAGNPPFLESTLLLLRGSAAEATGDFAGATAAYMRALELEHKTEDPTDIAIALQRLCTAEHQLGKIDDARRHCEEALATVREALGEDHPIVAEAEVNLGVTHAVVGELEQARKHWESALDRLERGAAPDAPAVVVVLLDLAEASRAMDDTAAADRYLARALALTEHAANSPEGLDVQVRVAAQLRAQGRLAEARPRLEVLARRAEALLGPNHSTTAHAYEDLGMAYYDGENYKGARVSWEKAVAASTALYGDTHPTTLSLEGRYGMAMMMMKDAEAARPVFEHALFGLQAAVEPDSRHLAQAYTDVADCLIALGDAAAAIEPATRGLAIREQRGDDALQTGEARFVLARALWRARKDRGAIAMARTARDEMRAYGAVATTLPDIERWLAGDR